MIRINIGEMPDTFAVGIGYMYDNESYKSIEIVLFWWCIEIKFGEEDENQNY